MKLHSVDVAAIEWSEYEIGVMGRDVTRVDHIHNSSLSDIKLLSANKGVKATINLKPDSKHVFCRARKVPFAIEAQVKIEFRHKESLPQAIQMVS